VALRAGAIAAGIVKEKTARQWLDHGWNKATPRERAAFLQAVGH
jgi:hypothetical protein